ncbi:uncharacterized protein LOC129591549 isoform X1 [Paramacrobiotus metropolitanus]|uniref:uncharacterized protein LOC129591549 isoform X1 n=1 Tax=Paramacrobiotus metropolitanus TaxID=2943436 RepID=UPI002445C00C|nr:uncharacterized protein LOC129591549 isoform X1 [Paramacrobiotus metropolitanus]
MAEQETREMVTIDTSDEKLLPEVLQIACERISIPIPNNRNSNSAEGDDDYPEHEKLVYRKVQPIYQHVWLNFVLSTFKFLLESVPSGWATHKNLITDHATLTAYATITKNDTHTDTTESDTDPVGSNWKLWFLWINMWIGLITLWLFSIHKWRPGKGKSQFREVILSLIAVKRSLEGIAVMMNCFGLVMALVWSVATWKEFLNGCPAGAMPAVEPIIGLVITPWTILAVTIVCNGLSCRSKISDLTKKFIRPAVPAQLLI